MQELLTKQERLIYVSIIEGNSNEEIAGELGITVKTVKFHITGILKKFKLKTRVKLIVQYYKDLSRGP